MAWGQLLLALVKGVSSFTKWLSDRQLIDAGEAAAVGRIANENLEILRKAAVARGMSDGDFVRATRAKYDRDRV